MNPPRQTENAEAMSNQAHSMPETLSNPFSSPLLETILDHMQQGVAVFDANLKLVIFNRRYLEIYEYPADLIHVGADYADILRFNAIRDNMDAGDIETYVAERLAMAREPNSESHRERVLPNGRVIATDHGPIPGGGFINTYTDITNLKKAEQDAIRNTAILRATFENMADGVRVFDKELRLIAWNSKAFEMLNYPTEMAKLGMPYADFLAYNAKQREYSVDSGPELLEGRLNRARRGEGRRTEVVTPDGRIIKKHRNPMPDGGFVSTYQDVTESDHARMMLQEAKEQAEQASRSKSEFLANMSHELRTPLNAIIGFSQIMCDELLGKLGSDTYREYARDIKDSGTHLLDIINDILDLSKVEAGKTQLNEDNVDIATLLQACVHLMEERAVAANVTLKANIPKPVPLVLCDERLMRQMILNLLSNAVKFTPSGGSVTASVEVGDGVVVTVTDTGIGIAEENLPKVLEPFVQVDNSLSRSSGGTGLGLPLVNSYAKLHNGKLILKSKLGEGTSAIIRLPYDRLVA